MPAEWLAGIAAANEPGNVWFPEITRSLGERGGEGLVLRKTLRVTEYYTVAARSHIHSTMTNRAAAALLFYPPHRGFQAHCLGTLWLAGWLAGRPRCSVSAAGEPPSHTS